MLAQIQAKLKAPKDKKNEFGGYAYRNAEGILRHFKDNAPEGVSLIMSDEITQVADRIFLTATARLFHDGKLIAEAKGAAMHAMQKKGMDDAQITGACSSYARKYALCGLFAIDDSADDPDAKDNRHVDDAPAKPTAQHIAQFKADMLKDINTAATKGTPMERITSHSKYIADLATLKGMDPAAADDVAAVVADHQSKEQRKVA